MKFFFSLFLSAGLLAATASGAAAYHLSPINIKAKLRGTLTFYPNGGNPPFKCKVAFDVKIRKQGAAIEAVRLAHGVDCGGLHFFGLPWGIGILTAKSGEFGFTGFEGGGGTCSEGSEQFTDNDAGIWGLPVGQCMSGRLTSHPSVIIVK